jgi:hypothetical protein
LVYYSDRGHIYLGVRGYTYFGAGGQFRLAKGGNQYWIFQIMIVFYPLTVVLVKLASPIRKRAIIETINDELKNSCQIEHTRHRSFNNFIMNALSAISAYCFLPKKACNQS